MRTVGDWIHSGREIASMEVRDVMEVGGSIERENRSWWRVPEFWLLMLISRTWSDG